MTDRQELLIYRALASETMRRRVRNADLLFRIGFKVPRLSSAVKTRRIYRLKAALESSPLLGELQDAYAVSRGETQEGQ